MSKALLLAEIAAMNVDAFQRTADRLKLRMAGMAQDDPRYGPMYAASEYAWAQRHAWLEVSTRHLDEAAKEMLGSKPADDGARRVNEFDGGPGYGADGAPR